jgi:hypothetical protein
MTLAALIPALLTALAAIPEAIALVEEIASAVTLWWMQRQSNETLAAISDAAALSAKAQSDEDRYQAAARWQSALSRPRVTSQ